MAPVVVCAVGFLLLLLVVGSIDLLEDCCCCCVLTPFRGGCYTIRSRLSVPLTLIGDDWWLKLILLIKSLERAVRCSMGFWIDCVAVGLLVGAVGHLAEHLCCFD